MSQGVRRSRRLAAKGVGAPTPPLDPVPAEECVPPTPCVNASPERFDDTSNERSLLPEAPAPTQVPRAVHACEPSVLDPMPSSSHSVGLAIHMRPSAKHMRHRSESQNPKSASPSTIVAPSSLSSSISSPRLGAEDWPLDEPLAKSASPPATPIVGPLESGLFSASELPEPSFPMVSQDDAQAAIPTRQASLAMERSATMRRELPLAVSTLPSAPGIVGLGIDLCGTDHAVEHVSTSLSSLTIDQAPRRALADRANAPVRVPLGEKSKAPARVPLGDKALAKGASLPTKGLSAAHAHERLDENGQPWAGPHVPTKRGGLAAPKKVRGAGAHGAQDGPALALSHPAGRGAPSLQVHTRPMYTLR
ncbi:hypothetical protein MCAP1_000346 [Malassezia caprae]|uniref:Uncharacterized protein n=1 Tax=Malassezia caprae TaxID=1381934 RepID=A0AAF0E4Q6_9BASI|nr:hypothetical protein MCAP1_000346 [Malassezia caprae]